MRPVPGAARLIHDGFVQYNRAFKRVTDRAKRRFEQRDWQGQFRDIAERVELYEQWASRTERALRKHLGESVRDHGLWQDIRGYFGERVEGVPDAGFMKTFFNSITRRIFGTVGVDPAVEFVQPPPEEGVQSLTMRHYPCWEDIVATCGRILGDFRVRVRFASRRADARFMAEEVRAYLRREGVVPEQVRRFEFIDSHFFQGTRAYLVGRLRHDAGVTPIVVALKNTDDGIAVDAVLMQVEQIGVVFSYTRSYYFADPTSVVAAVQFLHTLLPGKPIDELYTVLGRLRQGKTERYRVFVDHLRRTDDAFVHAAGDKGLVMIVFTLPSYNLVFKVMRDVFGAPKTTSHADVEEKYRLVSRHDHAGRLIDTQHFRNLELPLARFSGELLDDLLAEAGRTVRIEDDQVVFHKAYVERRVRPLNLHIREVDQAEARRVVLDYGQCIKDLAETNIFAGDLLLKNFGLTGTGRVVFYDYDEVALVTDCNFRELPDADEDFMMDPGTTRFVGANDIFPEEFIHFLSLEAGLREAFLEAHGDLLDPDYWRDVKRRRKRGEIAEVVPYARQTVPTALA
ncbi:MAG: bifunctional isocitrate dehydrogenase kinase/phosphatase [Halofilum sp. (in: g-proteobacteria)]|nr:bifunctional isocitrate dehydrogenase kinase/phosphatase [Halofilum sp. (in: g-proteobacteria)]